LRTFFRPTGRIPTSSSSRQHESPKHLALKCRGDGRALGATRIRQNKLSSERQRDDMFIGQMSCCSAINTTAHRGSPYSVMNFHYLTHHIVLPDPLTNQPACATMPPQQKTWPGLWPGHRKYTKTPGGSNQWGSFSLPGIIHKLCVNSESRSKKQPSFWD